jgi:L-alanine-DL-glutamate epimerase-like enolase superfamily enzyme
VVEGYRSMKITAIETLVCHARMRNWVFVKVVTDQPGLFGWGEATLEWHTRGVVGAIEDLSQLLIGEDPRRIEHLWQMMFRQHFWHGHGIVRSTAIAGIDLALWDILGKIHGVPCHQLWGGPVRDSIRLYCHLGGGNMESFYETPVDNAKQFADLARQAVEEGYTAFKSMAVPPTMPLEGRKPIQGAVACVAAMRDAVGDRIDIMVDCHARPSPAMGLQFAKALEPFGLYFLRNPVGRKTSPVWRLSLRLSPPRSPPVNVSRASLASVICLPPVAVLSAKWISLTAADSRKHAVLPRSPMRIASHWHPIIPKDLLARRHLWNSDFLNPAM